MMEYLDRGSIDLGIASSAFLVREGPDISDTGDREAMFDPLRLLLVESQPRNRPDGSGDEKEPIRESAIRPPCKGIGKPGRHRDPRQVVVRERRMADVAGDEDLILDLSLQQVLA